MPINRGSIIREKGNQLASPPLTGPQIGASPQEAGTARRRGCVVGKSLEIESAHSEATGAVGEMAVDRRTDVLTAVLGEVVQIDGVSADAHFFDDLGADSMMMARFCALVRKRDDVPPVSMKDVYQHPTAGRLASALGTPPAPPGGTGRAGRVERVLAGVMAEILEVEQVPVDAHFFDDLGADSMTMARFCARVRKHADVGSVAMTDVYRAPTVRSLAAALAGSAPEVPAASPDAAPAFPEAARTGGRPPLRDSAGWRSSCASRSTCGSSPRSSPRCYAWIARPTRGRAAGLLPALGRAGGAAFAALCVLPDPRQVGAVGRWKPGPVPRLERALPAVLAGQDADQDEPGAPAGGGFAACTPLPARPRRAGRAAASPTSPGRFRCAPICSRSASGTIIRRTRRSAATGRTTAGSRSARSRWAATSWSARRP